MKRYTFCIIGAGNGGRAFAAFLAAAGHEVRLCYRTRKNISTCARTRSIVSEGAVQGTFGLAMVTSNLAAGMAGAHYILVVLPAFAHQHTARAIAPHLEEDQVILLNPGRTWGAIEVMHVVQQERPGLRVYVGETQSLLFTCRAIGDHGVMIFKIKEKMEYCFFPETDNRLVADGIKEVFPQLVPVNNIHETSLNNIGAIIHPVTVILNAGPIGRHDDFLFYKQGMTREVVDIIKRIDEERCDVTRALGLQPKTFLEWAREVYNCHATDYYEAFQEIESYKDISAPAELVSRYITEDVPTGLVPIASLGAYFNIPTPCIDSIIDLASFLVRKNFKETGRTLTNVGIDLGKGLKFNEKERVSPVQYIKESCKEVHDAISGDWLAILGEADLVDLVKAHVFALTTDHVIAPEYWREYFFLKGKPYILALTKKTDELRKSFEMGSEFKRLFGIVLKRDDQARLGFSVEPAMHEKDKAREIKQFVSDVREFFLKAVKRGAEQDAGSQAVAFALPHAGE